MKIKGFGDAYPVTWPGHFLAIIAMLSGIVLLAMPISIIGQKFTQVRASVCRARHLRVRAFEI